MYRAKNIDILYEHLRTQLGKLKLFIIYTTLGRQLNFFAFASTSIYILWYLGTLKWQNFHQLWSKWHLQGGINLKNLTGYELRLDYINPYFAKSLNLKKVSGFPLFAAIHTGCPLRNATGNLKTTFVASSLSFRYSQSLNILTMSFVQYADYWPIKLCKSSLYV